MTLSHLFPFWKEAPFIRIIIPFLVGIIFQQEIQASSVFAWVIFVISSVVLFSLRSLSIFSAFRFNWIRGIAIHFLLFAAGWLIANANDGRQDQNSLLSQYRDSSIIKVKIEEPIQEKSKSYKATASVEYLLADDSIFRPNGKILIYFPKEDQFKNIRYGTVLIVRKSLQRIKNAGNPGGFDYITYCMRQHIYYSVFLKDADFTVAERTKGNVFTQLIFDSRQKILDILSKYIPSEKESGFAKALLIGYTDDLDKELVQSYSNTGVVHIIAISGLHLGIIFALLDLLVAPLKKKKYSAWIATAIIISGLWGFSFLAGAGPSVIRSAFMLSFVVIGSAISKRSNTLNNLAASAFVLLCIHPFWFWDLGFQLSYAAVLSILLFFKPIYNWFYFPNKIVDFAWKLNAVTLSAQVLTIPICIYYFHQLPVYFLLSNLLAVPWSSLILLGEITLCCLTFIPSVAASLGIALQWLIHGLNDYIERINSMPFSIWSSLKIDIVQLTLIFAFVAALALYLKQKKKTALIPALSFLLIILAIRSYKLLLASGQKKIIVYNIPHASAIDFINGRNVKFLEDSYVSSEKNLERFYFQPSRDLYQARLSNTNSHLLQSNNLVQFYDKFIAVANSQLPSPAHAFPIDLLILSKNAAGDLAALIYKTRPKLIVADGSNYLKKRNEWKKVCESMRIPYYDVTTEGALQLDLSQLSP